MLISWRLPVVSFSLEPCYIYHCYTGFSWWWISADVTLGFLRPAGVLHIRLFVWAWLVSHSEKGTGGVEFSPFVHNLTDGGVIEFKLFRNSFLIFSSLVLLPANSTGSILLPTPWLGPASSQWQMSSTTQPWSGLVSWGCALTQFLYPGPVVRRNYSKS